MKALEVASLCLVLALLPHDSFGDSIFGAVKEKGKFSHLKECTEQEAKQTACLNGGRCGAIVLFTSRLTFCMCGKYFKGRRCEEMDYFISIGGVTSESKKTSTTKILALAVWALLALVILIVGIVLVYKYCRRRQAQRSKTNQKKAKKQKNKENGTLSHKAEKKSEATNGSTLHAPLLDKDMTDKAATSNGTANGSA